ncbi:AAA family ATPase [Kibdelosporangium lantanae]
MDVVYTRLAEMRVEAEQMRDRGDQLAHGARTEAVFEQASMLYERDVMVRYANRTLQMLDSEHEGLVFGRLDDTGSETLYVGRLGIRDADFENLVTDWRAPAAAAFYQATAEQPMDVVRRRVIRSSGQRVIEIDDDLLMPEAQPADMQVVGEGALMATLNRARGDAMRDIVSTIQKEQDDAIRAPWRGVTEITGGPGTGKTAVALHRVAYLLYRDRKRLGSAGVLVLGPSAAFTSYISRVLPSMGEDSVELRSLGGLMDGIEATRVDPAPIAAVKGSLRMRRVLKKALRDIPPDAPTELRITYRGEVLKLDSQDLAKVRRQVHGLGRLPNRSRVDAAEALLEALWRKAESYEGFHVKRQDLLVDLGERIDFHRFVVVWWPVLTAKDVLGWLGDRARLARAAGQTLSAREIDQLAASWRLDDWSIADVALLDELRTLIGPPPKRRNRRAVQEEQYEPGRRRPENYEDYSHIVVDESQDLSPMQWRMVARRGQYASWTLVGDPLQSTWPDPAEAAQARDSALGKRTTRRRFSLRTNYRNSAEIFELAARVVRDVAAPGELPRAVRDTGVKPCVSAVTADSLPGAVRDAVRELLDQVDGTVGVIGAMTSIATVASWVADVDSDRLRVVDAIEAKGLEYDAVVLVEPTEIVAESLTGPRTLYVALTRATQRLTVLTTDPAWPGE